MDGGEAFLHTNVISFPLAQICMHYTTLPLRLLLPLQPFSFLMHAILLARGPLPPPQQPSSFGERKREGKRSFRQKLMYWRGPSGGPQSHISRSLFQNAAKNTQTSYRAPDPSNARLVFQTPLTLRQKYCAQTCHSHRFVDPH